MIRDTKCQDGESYKGNGSHEREYHGVLKLDIFVPKVFMPTDSRV